MWRFVLISMVSVASARAVTYDLGPVTVSDPLKVKVSAALQVTAVYEVEILKQARIVDPRLVFDTDFGLGLEVFPRIQVDKATPGQYSYISEWICTQLGYGLPIGTAGSREVSNGVVLEHYGKPGTANAEGLKVVKLDESKEVPTTLICELKKN